MTITIVPTPVAPHTATTLPVITAADALDHYARIRAARQNLGEYTADGEWEETTTSCGGCGLPLATEGDLMAHFVLATPGERSTGRCPVAAAADTLGVPTPRHPGNAPMVDLTKHPHAPWAWQHTTDGDPDMTDPCQGCAAANGMTGYALRDRATDLWLTRAVTMVDVAYTVAYGPTERTTPDQWGTCEADRRHVTVYETDRAYGGPEEGGWYFDTGTVEWSYGAGSATAADVIAGTLAAVVWPVGDDSSVNYRGGAHVVTVGERPGADYPAERPRYE